jgi:hypothetical protein
LLIQQKSGLFKEPPTSDFEKNVFGEDVDATFFDMDSDHDLDLYVVTGGSEFESQDTNLRDKLFRNDGKGNFSSVSLPDFFSSGSCVRPNDIDNDGDLDLFVGGRIVPGKYPTIPESYILQNDGKGRFTIRTDDIAPGLKKIGMVADATWLDVNKDGIKDLMVVGEWMGVHIFINDERKLLDKTTDFIQQKTEGWWNKILIDDFDKDGDDDFIVGNFGMNSQIKPSVSKPATLYYGDYDGNQSIDPFLCYYIGGQSYPFATRDELIDQVPGLKKRFPNYKSYATATIDSILSKEKLADAQILSAVRFETTYFRNDNGKFVIVSLPVQFQFAPIFAMACMDINGDGFNDILTGGNLDACRARTGMIKGNQGFVFLNDTKGNFSFVPTKASGINITADVRQIVIDRDRVFIATNNGPIKIFKVSASRDLSSTQQ